ncbi:MAG: xylulokinase, partial [Halanaerobiaceae bacterium]
KEKVGADRGYIITGHRLSASYSGSKIKWIMNNEKDIYRQTYKFLQPKDYIIAKLTGCFATDYSDASGTNLLDLKKLKWSEEIIDTLKLDYEKLPELKKSIDIAGTLKKDAAKALNLPQDIPVVIGAGDGVTASVGAGAVSRGKLYNYLGSSSWIALAADTPVYDEEKKTFNWVHAVPEMYVPCGTMQSAGASYTWLRDNIAWMENGSAENLNMETYDLMNLQVEKSSPGSGKLLFLPYLMGERSPHWNPRARGAFIGLSMNNNRTDIMRAVMEGVTFNLKIILDSFEKEFDFEEMRVIGGGAESKIWRQIMANIFRKKILKVKMLREAPSLGAAIIGGVGVNIFSDFSVVDDLNPVDDITDFSDQIAETYDSLYPVFKKSYKALLDIYDELDQLERR